MKKPTMHATKNDIPEKRRIEICELLLDRLADSTDLYIQTKQAHWNVKGPDFIMLHKLFDEVYAAVGEYVDLIAERIVQLGGQVHGTIRVAAKVTHLPEYPLEAVSGQEHVAALSTALAAYGKLIRAAIKTSADKLEDADTADIFTEVSRGIDQWLWMVEAHGLAKS